MITTRTDNLVSKIKFYILMYMIKCVRLLYVVDLLIAFIA